MTKLRKRSELARELGVAPETVDRWCREGRYGLKRVEKSGAQNTTVFIDITDFVPEQGFQAAQSRSPVERRI